MFTPDKSNNRWKHHPLIKAHQDTSTLLEEATLIDIIHVSSTTYITNKPNPLRKHLQSKSTGTFSELLTSTRTETFFQNESLTMDEADIRDQFQRQALIRPQTEGRISQRASQHLTDG
jgi:hypothetical protein